MADRQGIIIRFASEIRDFLTGKNRVKDELKDVEHSLGDVKDASDDQARTTTSGLKDVERAADDAKAATDKLGDSTEQAGTKGGSLVDTLSSGLLGVAGLAGGVAGVVSNVFGAAVDFVRGKITDQIEAAAELKSALIDAYVQAGAAGDLYLQKAQVIAAANDIIADSAKRAKAEQEAATIGVDANTYIRAQAGDYEALKVVIEAAQRAEDERRQEGADGSKSSQAAALADLQAIERVIKKNEELQQIHEEGQAVAEQTIQISQEIYAAEQDRIQRTRDAEQARYEALAEAQKKAANPPPIVQTVEVNTDKADADLAAWKRRFSTGGGARLTIVADVVDRNGKRVS